jgi:hypothetical protein|tara:strand:- start:23 stop:289 length:267 start_codon:yes stop_codon:yes gene_type:complete
MENIVTITLLTLTLFGKIEMTTFEIPNTREMYYDLGWKKSNSLVCSSWYHQNVVITTKKNPKSGENHYKHRWKGKKVIGYICGGHEPK